MMSPLRVEICNERLLQRFGVDRLLILLGQWLARAGHEVVFTCLRCERSMVETISREIYEITVPAGLDMAGQETAVSGKVSQRWRQRNPDVVVIGGWPFFNLAACANTFGARSIFIDAGAVAQNDLPASYLPVQLELRRIRQLTLPIIDRVLPISDFVRHSQTEPDRGSDQGVQTVLLGADHMAQGTFSGSDPSHTKSIAERVQAMAERGEQPVLVLGRFESGGYKNSSAAFELLRAVRRQVPRVRLLLLDAGQDCAVPADLAPFIELLGTPDDESLQKIMSDCAAGVSMSVWEGFNLPLAEMQWIGRPALAFNIGAHPEVVADPWFLCHDVPEMVSKLITLLQPNRPCDFTRKFATFREKRRWATTLACWEDEIVELAKASSAVAPSCGSPRTRRIVLVDVTNASLDPANPGVIRVTRKICSQLQRHSELDLVFVGWNGETGDYIFLNERRRQFLEGFGGPKDGLGLLATCGQDTSVSAFLQAIEAGRMESPVLFMPETMLEGQAPARLRWAKKHQYRSAAILYDLIPVFHKELCGAQVSNGFPTYLDALIQVDALWSISGSTLNDFNRYAEQSGQQISASTHVINLPGEFGSEPRANEVGWRKDNSSEIRILCVSTLEPRKNHLRLLEAYQKLRRRRPNLRSRLILVGNRYAGAPEIADQVLSASKRDTSIEWRGVVDDRVLGAEFKSADFTVYPSLVEGYGLPILESLWMGCPCLTHESGVMKELAVGGGCVTVDMKDVGALERELERLTSDAEFRQELTREAMARHLTSWEEYGIEIARRLAVL